MAKKSKRGNGNRPHGHFCKVCGEHKANERFSGKGHAAHICKKCSALPVAERNEMVTIRKIEGMSSRRLSESEIKWLRNHMKDQRPEVRDAAVEAHRIKFPRYERSMAKKGMTAFSLELYICDEIYDEWGDVAKVHACVSMEDTGELKYINYSMPEGERERRVQIEKKDARRFLKAVVHELDAPFWDEELSDAMYVHDPYLDVLPEHLFDLEFDMDDEDDEDVTGDEPEQDVSVDETREPLWSLQLELNTGMKKKMVFYNNMHDEPVTLFWTLMEYFDPEYDADDDLVEEPD